MSEVRIYVEGGGNGKEAKIRLRAGFDALFRGIKEEARQRRAGIRFIPSGSRSETFKDFADALKTHPQASNLVLVDADGPVNGTLVEHVRSQPDCCLSGSVTVHEDQVHLMVQLMETWFLADRAALRAYYGSRFRQDRLPGNPRVEDVSKDDVLRGLRRATEDTRKGVYHKTRHAPEILAHLDPGRVRQAAPACDRLWRTVEHFITGEGVSGNP